MPKGIYQAFMDMGKPEITIGERDRCKNGHVWNTANVSVDKDGKVRCKRCAGDRDRERKRKKYNEGFK